jgi:hypothetical protein
MNLFSELLFTSDHPDLWRVDASESQPVSTDDSFKRLHNQVTNTGIEVESSKDPLVHSSFDRKTGAAIRRGGQVHDRLPDHELEPVTEIDVGRALQHFPDDLVRVTTHCCFHSLNRQVNIHRCSSRPESQLERITALQNPWRWFFPEQPCQQTVE